MFSRSHQQRLQHLLLKAEIWLHFRKSILLRPHVNQNFCSRSAFFKWKIQNLTMLSSVKRVRPYQVDPSNKLLSCYCLDYSGQISTLIADLNSRRIVDAIPYHPHQTVLVNEDAILYSSMDKKGRPWQIWCHEINKKGNRVGDRLLLQADLECSMLKMSLSRDQKYVIVTTSTRLSTEVHTLPVSICASFKPSLVLPMKDQIQYFVDHAHGKFYMMTNQETNNNNKILTSTDASEGSWKDFFVLDNDFIIQDLELFERFIVVYGNTLDVKPAIKVIDPYADGRSRDYQIFENHCLIEKPTQAFNSDFCKIYISSPVMPQKPYIITNHEISRRLPFTATNEKCVVANETARNEDGTFVPITLFYRRGVKFDGTNPLLVFVYGSHGVPLHMGYKESSIPLLRRGWILSYCHVRGGGELGTSWHLGAVKHKKRKTIEDLVTCVKHLHKRGYSSPLKTAILGKSAGALAVGNLCNNWPQLVQAAILEMPYVNLYRCLSEDNCSLVDCLDMQEFGDPRHSNEEEKIVKSLCPFHNLRPQDYPSFFISASVSDELIDIDDVDQYVSVLKNCIQHYQGTEMQTLEQNTNLHLPRGTVVYHRTNSATHYESSSNKKYSIDQEARKMMFLLQTIGYS